MRYLAQHHGAVRFIEALKAFVSTLPHGHQYFEPNVNDWFDCFSNVIIPLQPEEHMLNNVQARIRCHLQHSNGQCKPLMPARFDTILVGTDDEAQEEGGFYGFFLFIPRSLSNHVYRTACG